MLILSADPGIKDPHEFVENPKSNCPNDRPSIMRNTGNQIPVMLTG